MILMQQRLPPRHCQAAALKSSCIGYYGVYSPIHGYDCTSRVEKCTRMRMDSQGRVSVVGNRGGSMSSPSVWKSRRTGTTRAVSDRQEQVYPPSTSDHGSNNNSSSSSRRFNVVITGGTKGAGKALAQKFLESGDNVMVCSRDEGRVLDTIDELKKYTGESNTVLGLRADVTRASDMTAVAAFASESFGSVDIWVNNAGTNGYSFKPFFEQSDEDIESVVSTNVLGVMYGTKAAINCMKKQPHAGHIFNMDGAGADGNATPRFAAYGATKRSLEQFNKSMRAELSIAKIQNVGVHAISPGMVTTELLMAGADSKISRFMINCLAETPETMANFLVPAIREVPGKVEGSMLPNVFNGQYIKFLTPVKAYSQILMRFLVGLRKDKFVKEDDV